MGALPWSLCGIIEPAAIDFSCVERLTYNSCRPREPRNLRVRDEWREARGLRAYRLAYLEEANHGPPAAREPDPGFRLAAGGVRRSRRNLLRRVRRECAAQVPVSHALRAVAAGTDSLGVRLTITKRSDC